MKCMLYFQIIFFILLIKSSLFSCNNCQSYSNAISILNTNKITVRSSVNSKSNKSK